MKNFSIVLFVALVALALGGCDKIAELRGMVSSEDGEDSAPAAHQPPASGEAMAKAMAEAMAEAMGQMEDAMAELDEPGDEAREPSLVERAEELAGLRRRLEADPSALDRLLAEAGLTEDALEDLLFQIAEDPDASAAYAESR